MPLNRRIVLEGPIATPKPEKPKKKAYAVTPPPGHYTETNAVSIVTNRHLASLPIYGFLNLEELHQAQPQPSALALTPAPEDVAYDRQNTMQDFFNEAGMKISKQFVKCKQCNDIANFDADFDTRVIRCCSCGRIITFELFEQEHQ